MLLKKMVMMDGTPVVFRYNPETRKGVMAVDGTEDRKAEKLLSVLKASVKDVKFYGKRVRMIFTASYGDIKKGMDKVLEDKFTVVDLPDLGRMLWDSPSK